MGQAKELVAPVGTTASTKAPVFIVACPRSGTRLLYHMLLSTGAFAQFRTEMNVFNLLVPIFGDLGVAKNRRRMIKEWLQSKAFTLSGLEARQIEAKVMAECKSGGDFLRIVLEEICRQQNVDRWADSTPTNLLHIRDIMTAFPDALVIHIIRDGRDVALSLDRLGWLRPLPWDRDKSLMVAGLYWKWIIERGRELVRANKPNYLEIYFEDLVNKPDAVVAQVGDFIGCPMDYAHIQEAGIGVVGDPASSSSFGAWGEQRSSRPASERCPIGIAEPGMQRAEFNAVGRWKKAFTQEQTAFFEGLVGELLGELGYPLAVRRSELNRSFAVESMRTLYPLFFDLKQWVRTKTRLARFFVKYSQVLVDK